MATVHIVDDDAGSDCDKPRLLQAAGYDVVVYRSAEELPARLPELSEPVFLQPTLRDGAILGVEPGE